MLLPAPFLLQGEGRLETMGQLQHFLRIGEEACTRHGGRFP